MSFEKAFAFVIGEEGKLSLVASDRGNWTTGIVGVGQLRGTKYGISAMAYPQEDIANLTLDRARELYKRDYWNHISGDSLPESVGLGMFDTCVNEGVSEAIRLAQKAADLNTDGVMGPVTLARLSTAGKLWSRNFAIARIVAYSDMAYWKKDHDGWVGRVLDVYQQMIM